MTGGSQSSSSSAIVRPSSGGSGVRRDVGRRRRRRGGGERGRRIGLASRRLGTRATSHGRARRRRPDAGRGRSPAGRDQLRSPFRRGRRSGALLAFPAEPVVVLYPLGVLGLGAPALDAGQLGFGRGPASGSGRDGERRVGRAPVLPRLARLRSRAVDALPAEVVVPAVDVGGGGRASRASHVIAAAAAGTRRTAPARPRRTCGLGRATAACCRRGGAAGAGSRQGRYRRGRLAGLRLPFRLSTYCQLELALTCSCSFRGLYCGRVPAREEDHSAKFAPRRGPPPRPAPVIVAFGLKPERLVGAEGRIDAVPEPPTAEQAGLLVDALALRDQGRRQP